MMVLIRSEFLKCINKRFFKAGGRGFDELLKARLRLVIMSVRGVRSSWLTRAKKFVAESSLCVLDASACLSGGCGITGGLVMSFVSEQ